jgi:hypothetical protein
LTINFKENLRKFRSGLEEMRQKYMRAFSEAYPEEQFAQQVAAQIPQFHNCLLLDEVKDLRSSIYLTLYGSKLTHCG